jgi:hypothetical protein
MCKKLQTNSQLLLLNFEVNHIAKRKEQWMYVYDKEMYSTRINFIESLSPSNAPANKSGIQVEIYFSKYKPIDHPYEYYVSRVSQELVKMGLIESIRSIENVHTQWIPYANVIFDHKYENALNAVLNWLNLQGLSREHDDLLPMTNWDEKFDDKILMGDIILAGRFGQWKYYWTDDCILRGKYLSELLNII